MRMLEVEGLVVRYGRLTAVREVSFVVGEGEAVAIVGPNGAGKSSTLTALVGIVPVAAGSVRLEGTSIVGQPPERLVRRGMSLVPEGRRIFATLSVAENLQLGATTRRDGAAVASEIRDVYERFPALGTLRKQHAGKLSGGQQQQLAIARAVLAKPRLLMLDEPSLGLAPLVIDQVFEMLEDLKREGVTVLLVEQNAARAVAFAERSYVLRSGRVVLEGTSDELLHTEDFVSTYLGVSAEDAERMSAELEVS
jgi:branched-chain amino acid transport system ATP-binding protein